MRIWRRFAIALIAPCSNISCKRATHCLKGWPSMISIACNWTLRCTRRAGFPNPSRETDQVIIIALSDNRGWNRLIHTKEQTEREALEELVQVIRDVDPDVIEGHNIFAFDFMYLRARFKRHRIPFAIGRDGSVPRTFPSSMRFCRAYNRLSCD